MMSCSRLHLIPLHAKMSKQNYYTAPVIQSSDEEPSDELVLEDRHSITVAELVTFLQKVIAANGGELRINHVEFGNLTKTTRVTADKHSNRVYFE